MVYPQFAGYEYRQQRVAQGGVFDDGSGERPHGGLDLPSPFAGKSKQQRLCPHLTPGFNSPKPA
jgi:hypothetical protein